MFKMLPFPKKSKTKVQYGLEVGSFSVKLAEVNKKPDGYELSNFAVAQIKGDRVRQNILDAIREVTHKFTPQVKKVNTSVFGQSVVVRYIQMPKMSDTELRSAVKFEAEKHIPFKINEVNIDAQIIGDTDKGMMAVLLAAAKKDAVERHTTLLNDAGLEVNLIDADALCLSNIFLLKAEAELSVKVCALLNIGAKATTVNIYRRGQACFTREVNIGGDELTKAIANKLNISKEAAEDLKCRLPSDKAESLNQAMQTVIDGLMNEIRISFDYFESQFAESVSKIYISGGSSALKGLDKTISQSLGMATAIWNPVSALQLKGDLAANKDLSLVSPSLGVSLGLALRE